MDEKPQEDKQEHRLNHLNQMHAGMCQALADPTRISLLYELKSGPKNVSELVGILGIPQATTSRHLKILRDRRLVTTKREGVHVYYSLTDPRVLEALDTLRNIMAAILSDQASLVVSLGEEEEQ